MRIMFFMVYKMKEYKILKTESDIFPHVCFVNTIEDIYFLMDEIEEEMKDLNTNKMLIDLFLSNGFGFNRFFEFNSHTKEMNLINPRIVDEKVCKIVKEYLNKNQYILNGSALSLSLIEIILDELKI